MEERVKQVKLPVLADSVLSPCFLYGDCVGLYFVTSDDQYGRITFENLDAVKICRGEAMPYSFDYSSHEKDVWVYVIENSNWQRERFEYEKKHYGSAYEFGGNVNEMLTDFKHYLFEFHDEFIEVIARGLWFEKSEKSLFQKSFQKEHPFLPLLKKGMKVMQAHTLKCQIRLNPKPKDKLIYGAQFCSQKLFEFALELEGKASVNHSVTLSYRRGKLISTLRGYFGNPLVEYEGVVELATVKPYIEDYMAEVFAHRKAMNK